MNGLVKQDKIPSFQRDHIDMKPGLYLQEIKRNIFIYDLRFVKPNTRFIPIKAIHTIEHLFATYLKTNENSLIANVTISFNPGGCQTMFYLELFETILSLSDIAEELIKCIDWCLCQTKVPGAFKEECGNYKSHDLIAAKSWLMEYKEILTRQFSL